MWSVESVKSLRDAHHDVAHSEAKDNTEGKPSDGPVSLGVHAGESVDLVWKLLPLGVSDARGKHWKVGSVGIVGGAHVGHEESKEDAGHDEDQESSSPELKVLGLSSLASSPDEVSAPEHTKTATDGSDVDDDLEVTVSSCHLGVQGGHDVAHVLSLAGGSTAHLDSVLGPESDLLGGGARPSGVEGCTHGVSVQGCLVVYHEVIQEVGALLG